MSERSNPNPEILLVEDNAADLELAVLGLRRHTPDVRIQVARDGVEALDYLFARGEYAGRQETALPAMILLDLKLPRLDGLEVLSQVKADARTRSVPVVVLTSSREQRDLLSSYGLGANSYVVKPVNFDQFTAVIGQLDHYWLALNQRPGR